MAPKQMEIQGMTCVHCEKTIAEALTRAGAYKVEADWREGRATLDVVDATDEQLKAVVEEAGYKVVSIEDAKREKSSFKPLVGDKGYDYDLVVIGSGSAAFAAPIRATQTRARAALSESTPARCTLV